MLKWIRDELIPAQGSGPKFTFLNDIAIDPNRDRILALDEWVRTTIVRLAGART